MNKPTYPRPEPMDEEEANATCQRIDALVDRLGMALVTSPTDIIEDITALLFCAAVAGKSKDVPAMVLVQMFTSLIQAPRTNESVARVQTAEAIARMKEKARASS